MAARCACNSAPRRSASMAAMVSASVACSISLSATVPPFSVSCARYTSAIPPRPSLRTISYLPILRLAGAIMRGPPATTPLRSWLGWHCGHYATSYPSRNRMDGPPATTPLRSWLGWHCGHYATAYPSRNRMDGPPATPPLRSWLGWHCGHYASSYPSRDRKGAVLHRGLSLLDLPRGPCRRAALPRWSANRPQEEVELFDGIRGGRFQHVAVEYVAQQRWFGAVARGHSRAFIRLDQIVREPRRARPKDEHAFGQAIADGIGAQHGAGAAANLNADSGALHFHIVDLHHGIAQQNAGRKRHLRIGQDAEAAEARPLDVFGDDGGSVAHGRGAQFGLSGNASAQGHAVLQAHLLAILALGDFHRVPGAALGHGGGDGGGHRDDARRNHHRCGLPHGPRQPAQGCRRHEPGREQQRARHPRAARSHGRRDRRRGELFSLHHQHGDVVLASGAIGRRDQLPRGGLRVAGMALHGGANFRRRNLVAQAIAAQQQRAFGIERKALHFDEIGIVRSMLLAAHIAEDLIAARVAHGVRLAQFAVVLAFAHRRMIVRDLPNFAAAHLVEPRIANVSHHRRPVFQYGQGEHARHAGELRVSARRAQNFVVGHGDGLAYALLDGAGQPLQARAHPLHGDFRRLLAGGLPADADRKSTRL